MAWTYRPSLDGLRMLSMYLIVLYHAGVPWLRGSFIAVDLFFVLSGFLVTNVILSEVDRTGRLSLRDFYARRVRRLMPAALVAIVGTSLVFLLVASVVRRLSILGDAQAALLYVANWRYIAQANDYFAADGEASPFLHYWTLSIEEQFYVLFPLLLVALVRWRRSWAVPAGLTVVFLLSLAAQVYWGLVDPIHAYYGTDARAYQLIAGALLAVALRHFADRTVPRWAATASATSGLLLFLVLTPTSWVEVSQSVRGIVATVAILAMIFGLMQAESQPLGRLLARRTPVYLGQITYATYLWHWPIVLVLGEILAVRPLVLAALTAILATAMAAASNELVELPIRKAKPLNRFAWPVVGAGVTASVVAAVAVVPVVLESERRPVLVAGGQGTASVEVESAIEAQEAVARHAPQGSARQEEERRVREARRSQRVPDDIDWKAVQADTGTQGSCTPDDPAACTVRTGDGPHVLLVGDSHAMMVADAFDELAREHDLTLSLNIVSACPWQEGLLNTKFGDGLQERCADARVGWYDEVLPELDPDLVVMLARPRDDASWRDEIARRDGRSQPLERATLQTSRETVAKVRDTGAEVVLVQQLAIPETFDPQECLATARTTRECAVAVPVDPAPSNGFFDSLAADDEGVHTVNLNPALCPGGRVCSPYVDDRVVWRDKAHFTAEYVVHRRDQVWKALTGTGALN